MDFIKKASESMSGNSNNTANTQQGGAAPAQGQTQGNAGSEDYGDKGLDFIEKKSGHSMGRDTNEKITDGARGMYEKATGFLASQLKVLELTRRRWCRSQVDPKYSN
ncbi:hypothetical protein LSUE1_G009846 [Lachnellula suecica]|uniref:Uncharacterized protein n=1 Tax=Lachnellula suecica TaxID=602035 RepID=A0A8T9BRP3_9HELO|nr:hypothetical protein LSUE1_G009846 [Lachnellula suecica]